MPYEPERPSFPSYLLPSLSFPLASAFSSRRRQSSSTSAGSSFSQSPTSSRESPPGSPGWSPNTTPSSSPTAPGYFSRLLSISPSSAYSNISSSLRKTGPTIHDIERDRDTKLERTAADTLKCATCSADFAFSSQIVSKGFTGRHGRAYLVSAPEVLHSLPSGSNASVSNMPDLVNIRVGRAVNRQLVTGAHVVADISCRVCETVVGWKYVDAREAGQRYKIGKFILETKKIVLGRRWEDKGSLEEEGPHGDAGAGKVTEGLEAGENGMILFDSEDEDECDDLFSGTWEVEAVKKRRGRRLGHRR
ncbi:MAG: hypothetical protein M1818_004452 [Claussenomyces sp. TS43310]|nr:MAG: hypothetical protein M1818_004452 [Claussenomyces sp. TS43310]